MGNGERMAEKAKTGRPNAWETIIEPAIKDGTLEKLAKQAGMTKRNIAKALGVSYSVFMQCQKDFSELQDIFKKTKQSRLEEIEMSAKKEAVGYWITETKTTRRKDEAGKMVAVVEEYKKWCRPSTAMQIFLLKNISAQKGHKGIVYDDNPINTQLRREELQFRKDNANEWG